MTHIDDINTQKANMEYIRSVMNEPLLDKELEIDLAKKWKHDRDQDALHQLISAYARLVVSMATKFKNYGLPIGDLIQEGNIGLLQAAEKFDPDRNIRFSTYASWWVRAAIQDYVLRNWSIVRTGTTAAQKSLFFNLRRLKAKIEKEKEQEGLSDNDRKKIAKKLNVRIKDVHTMEGRLSGIDSSLNNKIKSEDSEDEWLSLLADNRPNPEDVVIGMKDSQTRSQWLNDALNQLSEREQKIISDRHLGYETVTLEALGKELGISKERVRQLEKRAMMKLKDTLSDTVSKEELIG